MEPEKMAPDGGNRRQSVVLVWIIAPLLALGAVWPPLDAAFQGHSLASWTVPLLLSVGFAVLVWLLKAATRPAAAIGLVICIVLVEPRRAGGGMNVAALSALI